jgi:hypothetical protein
VFWLIVDTFKGEFIWIIIIFFFDALLRLAIEVLIHFLLLSIADGNTQIAYIYSTIIAGIWYTNQLVKQTGFVRSYILASRIKSALAMLLYAKISSLTSYVIKSSQLGKITNLLASDLGVI